MAHHVDRIVPLDPRVLINEIWYNMPLDRPPREAPRLSQLRDELTRLLRNLTVFLIPLAVKAEMP